MSKKPVPQKPGGKTQAIPEKKDVVDQVSLQKIQDESRKREDEIRRIEEAKKTDVLQISTGLRLVITEHCLAESWKHTKPKEFLTDFITKLFKREGIFDNFESVEIGIIAEFHLYNLIFAKEELQLDDYKSCILVNILRLVLQKDNSNYSRVNIKKLEEEIKRSTRSEKRTTMLIQQHKSNSGIHNSPPHRNSRANTQEDIPVPKDDHIQKTFESDIEFLRRILFQHATEKPPEKLKIFDLNHVHKILEYMKIGYFSHYNLFKYVLNSQNKKEEIKIVVCVNIPLEVAPLSEALFMGKNHFVVTDEEEEYKELVFERMKIREQTLRLEKYQSTRKGINEDEDLDGSGKVDKLTLDLIQQNFKEVEHGFEKNLMDHEDDLQEKMNAIDKPGGPKKK